MITASCNDTEKYRLLLATSQHCSCSNGQLSTQWKHSSFRANTPKTIGAVKIKYGTIDYAGKENPHTKFINNGITG